jgi:hypothetical protein
VDQGAGQDRQVRAFGGPAAVTVDQGVHAVPGPGPGSSVERGVGEGEFLVRFGVRLPWLGCGEGGEFGFGLRAVVVELSWSAGSSAVMA